MHRTVGDQVFRLGYVVDHVRLCEMQLECIGAFPLFNENKSVVAKRCLRIAKTGYINGRAIFETTLFGAYGRQIGVHQLERFSALAWFGGNDCSNVDHLVISYWVGSDKHTPFAPAS